MSAENWTVTQEMTTPSRPGKRPRAVWVVRGNTIGYEEELKAAGGRKYLGAWSFWSDPTTAIAGMERQTFAERQEAKQDRAEDRAERREEWADKAAARSEAAHKGVRRIADAIPFGQPILVGHHSERHARKDQDRIHSGMRKAIDEEAKAKHHARMASIAREAADPRHTVAFMARRIKDAETGLRDVDRKLAGSQGEPTGEWLERLTAMRADFIDRLGYWKAKMEVVGGVQHDKTTIAKGDRVLYGHAWYPVVRVNTKTVTVSHWLGIPSMTWQVPYPEVRDHRAAAQEKE